MDPFRTCSATGKVRCRKSESPVGWAPPTNPIAWRTRRMGLVGDAHPTKRFGSAGTTGPDGGAGSAPALLEDAEEDLARQDHVAGGHLARAQHMDEGAVAALQVLEEELAV